jgi:hypothetical protein
METTLMNEVLSRKFCENRDIAGSDIIKDYGTLTEYMPKEFYEADAVCILVGNRIWETDEIKRTRALSKKCIHRLFLVNLTDALLKETTDSLASEIFMAVPYIRDPDEFLNNPDIRSVFQELAIKTGVIK